MRYQSLDMILKKDSDLLSLIKLPLIKLPIHVANAIIVRCAEDIRNAWSLFQKIPYRKIIQKELLSRPKHAKKTENES